jgi:8-oxo-dGTP diphosphatase
MVAPSLDSLFEPLVVTVVRGFLVENDHVLLLRRAPDERRFPGHYELPGGKVRPGEPNETALSREFLEETGNRIQLHTQYYPPTSYFSEQHDKLYLEFVYDVYRHKRESIVLSKAHDDLLWLPVDRLRENLPDLVTKETYDWLRMRTDGWTS